MSDDEEDGFYIYADDDDYLYEPEDELGDLIEQTDPGPIYSNFDPFVYFENYLSDWEYYTDEYYDVDITAPKPAIGDKGTAQTRDSRQGKRKRTSRETSAGRKKRKIDGALRIPALTSEECFEELLAAPLSPTPVVLWRAQEVVKPPLVPGTQPKVALLPDWRARLHMPRRRSSAVFSDEADGEQEEEIQPVSKPRKAKKSNSPANASRKRARKQYKEKSNEPAEEPLKSEHLWEARSASPPSTIAPNLRKRVRK